MAKAPKRIIGGVTQYFINGQWRADCFPVPKSLEPDLRKAEVKEAFNNPPEPKDLRRQVHKKLYTYALARHNNEIGIVPLAIFCSTFGCTVEQLLPILRDLIKRGSESDRILFERSVHDG